MPEATACAKCGSEKIIPQVRIRDLADYNMPSALSVAVDENPEAIFFKETFTDALTARVCGECGHAELYVTQPRELYAAYERSKLPRD